MNRTIKTRLVISKGGHMCVVLDRPKAKKLTSRKTKKQRVKK